MRVFGPSSPQSVGAVVDGNVIQRFLEHIGWVGSEVGKLAT